MAVSWAVPREQMRHAEYVGGRIGMRRMAPSPEWKRRNEAFRSDAANRACRCCPPVLRRHVKTQTHHCYYRCGVCKAEFSYWTQLAQHWLDEPSCGRTRRRLGGERDSDLRSLCDFHHATFERLIRSIRDRRIRDHRPIPNRKRLTMVYIAVWWSVYLMVFLVAMGAIARV
jgi:hypothetical protein